MPEGQQITKLRKCASANRRWLTIAGIALFAGLCQYIFFAYGIQWINYEKPEAIEADVREYLEENYKNVEFEIDGVPFQEGVGWTVNIRSLDDERVNTSILWSKNEKPHIYYDGYLDDKWKKQALPEVEKYFRDKYGEDTQVFFLFQCMDNDFKKTEAAKAMDYHELIEMHRSSIYMEIQCYAFENEDVDVSLENQKAMRIETEFLDRTASDWDFQVFYLSKNFKPEFSAGFAKDFNFIRLKDVEDYKKMHEDGQLIEWCYFYRMAEEGSGQITPTFHFAGTV